MIFFHTKKSLLAFMLNLLRKSRLSLVNLFNFYVEVNNQGYILHLSRPIFTNEDKLINGLKFYLTNIRK
jgi:hypothetical protein